MSSSWQLMKLIFKLIFLLFYFILKGKNSKFLYLQICHSSILRDMIFTFVMAIEDWYLLIKCQNSTDTDWVVEVPWKCPLISDSP